MNFLLKNSRASLLLNEKEFHHCSTEYKARRSLRISAWLLRSYLLTTNPSPRDSRYFTAEKVKDIVESCHKANAEDARRAEAQEFEDRRKQDRQDRECRVESGRRR